jgi:tetratricopeptide (TPR) repeat protein
MEGKDAGADLRKLIDHTQTKAKELSGEMLAARYQALAEAALLDHQEDLALACLSRADSSEARIRQGDLLGQRRQWPQALQHYQQAWDKDHNNPLPLVLQSEALAQMGRYEGRDRLARMAHWLLLGEVMPRYQLLRQLDERRLKEDADWESALILGLSEPESYYSGAIHRRLALASAACQEHLQAARDYELSMLRCLRSSTTFVQVGAYVNVPALVHRQRALGLADAGKFEQALEEAALAQQITPGNLDLPIALVQRLEVQGRSKDADRLYQQTLGVFETLCREYPRFAQAHNSAAWLSACCRRDLDSALAHARRAVELAPESAVYLDTLAEVQFQRGSRKDAIAAQERAIKLDPRRSYYRQQLERLQHGSRSSPRPQEHEE